MGHESLATTEVYLDVTDNSLKNAVDLLGAGRKVPDRLPAGDNFRRSLVFRILPDTGLKENADVVLADQVKRHAGAMAAAARTLSEVRQFIARYREDKTFTVTESSDFPGTFGFQPLPARGPALGSFLNSSVALALTDIEYFCQHLADEFPALNPTDWRELVTRRAPLPPEVTFRISSLGNHACFRYCPACPVYRDLSG